MKKITDEELESIIKSGKEVLGKHFDAKKLKPGKPISFSGRKYEIVRMNLDITKEMTARLDELAESINISRQAVIKMFLLQALDSHDLAQQRFNEKKQSA